MYDRELDDIANGRQPGHAAHLLGAMWLAGVGRATNCAITDHHRPTPLRYVWHHILPLTCGGKSEAANLVSLCDSCHFAVHMLMTDLKLHNGQLTIPATLRTRKRERLARSGYQQAVAAGTVDKIPNEGSWAA
jgi:hypothetical protein